MADAAHGPGRASLRAEGRASPKLERGFRPRPRPRGVKGRRQPREDRLALVIRVSKKTTKLVTSSTSVNPAGEGPFKDVALYGTKRHGTARYAAHSFLPTQQCAPCARILLVFWRGFIDCIITYNCKIYIIYIIAKCKKTKLCVL
jgi:hypothetical protein